ncbi:2-amino-4-hydroxy-6-hydroxymethyldihydropteridine diphosphokinase [Pseudokineococcus sp. 1T1Z-3]|uniref:2-amino-4-hydroxy-6- hydroxymethyldihydropteridine diphosphokinase n=1 Tax=Pseudokineococcus sp. 1T1Z-3 TaxID=3132745 RepID=UPI0030A9CD05
MVVRVRRTAAVPDEPVTPVVLALGSDLGDRAGHLRGAVAALAAVPGLTLTAVSPVVESAPVRLPGHEPAEDEQRFLNAVALGTTALAPRAVLAACQAVEDAAGRVRRERWGPRTLDVDVVDLGGVVDTGDEALLLPHPRAHERAFVLVPWALADPGAALAGAGGGSVGELAARLLAADPAALQVRPDVVLTLPDEAAP